MSQVPTPPSIGNWSIQLEDEKSQSGTSINIPGIGECWKSGNRPTRNFNWKFNFRFVGL